MKPILRFTIAVVFAVSMFGQAQVFSPPGGSGGSGGSGNVIGAASSVSGNVALFTGTDGKHLQDSGFAPSVFSRVAYLATNVKAYGALGDGSTNDYTAIAAAYAATPSGGCLYFPAGTYIVGSTLTLSKPSCLFSDSQASATIKLAASTNLSALNITSGQVSLMRITVDGNASNETGGNSAVMVASGLSGVYFNSITVTNSQGSCVTATGTSNLLVSNSIFSACLTTQFFYVITGSATASNLTFSNDVFDSTGGGATTFVSLFINVQNTAMVTGVIVEGCTAKFAMSTSRETDAIVLSTGGAAGALISQATVSNNQIFGVGTSTTSSQGIELWGVDRFSVVGNTITNAYVGILAQTCTTCTSTGSILGNTIAVTAGASNVGISATLKSHVSIQGNVISGYANAAISIDSTTFCVASENLIYNTSSTGFGIQVKNSSDVTVSGNEVVGNGSNGQYAYFTGGSAVTNITFSSNRAASVTYAFVFQATTHSNVAISGSQFTSVGATYNNPPATVQIIDTNGTAFASLPALAAAGSQFFCTDCKNSVDNAVTIGAVAVGSGNGAQVNRVNATWRAVN